MSFGELTSQREQLEAIEEHPRLVLFFSKRQCPYCIEIEPSVKSLMRHYPKVKFYKIEISNTKVSNIVGVPLFSFYKNGEYKGKVIGGDLGALEREIKKLNK
jgi:thiol-disulfide isomerase/thioredoxin